MSTDPIMAGYAPLIATNRGVFQAEDYPPRIRGLSTGQVEQAIAIYPEEELNLGTVVSGQTSATYQVLIVNRGYKLLTIDSIEVVGDFSITLPNNLTLRPAEVLSVPVQFKPKHQGAYTGALYVTAGNAEGDRFLKLLGTGS